MLVKRGYQGASIACAQCHGDARFVSRRSRIVVCLFGTVFVQRPYYHCRDCSQGVSPWDCELGLTKRFLTPAVAELTALVGTMESFARSAEVSLRKLTGVRVSESTVQRVTEDAGARLGNLLEQRIKLGEDRTWDWQRDARGCTCGYASLDATGVRRQGENGARIEGKMAYVASIYNPNSEFDDRVRDAHQVRYLAGFYDLDQLGVQLRRQAGQVGWDEVDQQIAISDGGGGMEAFLRGNFPLAEIIIDFWHAKEHLLELAKEIFDEDAARQIWMDKICHKLKHEGGSAVLTQLQEMTPESPALHELHRQTVGYFHNHQHKMDYPRYVSNGWQIGSGPIESACRTVVGDRLKASGMRWGDDGADSVCHLRALARSELDQWDEFWRLHRN